MQPSNKVAPSRVKNTRQLHTVPAAVGYTIKMREPVVRRNGNKATIVGSDFASNVYKDSSGDYQPGASCLINPAYFQGAMLGSLARTYEKYRLVKGIIEYVPSVATSNSGQVVMTVVRSCKNPYISTTDTSFLSRALSSGNAIATPVWHGASIELLPQEDFFNIDSGMDGDLDDTISQEVQVYCFGAATQTCGILLFHYEFEFKDPLYSYHAGDIPYIIGNGILGTWADDGAVNATTDAIRLTTSAFSGNNVANGTIIRLVFVAGRSTLPTGPATWSNVAKVQQVTATTTSASTTTTSNLSLTSGTVLYGLKMDSSNTTTLYASYETATIGGQQGLILYQTATTAVGSWAFFTTFMRYGATEYQIAS